MKGWLERVEENVRTRKLFRDGESILVAVSGGVDSMVLLHALHQLQGKHRWQLAIAHFNHQLRGRSSDADEKLVRRTAATLRLPLELGSEDVKAFAKKKKLSIEMAARELRHAFFAAAADTRSNSAIALAHHADDQAELFFLRLLRGAGSEGLGGMHWSSSSPVNSRINLIRPLLDFTKEELLTIANEEGVPFREDATNAQKDFLRNRVRHELLPLLSEIQPGVRATVLRTMEIVRAEAEFVLNAALDWLASKPRPAFKDLSIAVQRICLRLQVRALGFTADFDLIEQLRFECDRPVSVAPGMGVERTADGQVRVIKEMAQFSETSRTIHLTKQPSVQFGGIHFSWSFESKSGRSFKSRPKSEVFDADAVGTRVILRHWRPGDRFQPIGMPKPVKLQDLFVNLKVPQDQRHTRVLAEAENGELFWVQGLRISERFKLTDKSRRRLRWYFE